MRYNNKNSTTGMPLSYTYKPLSELIDLDKWHKAISELIKKEEEEIMSNRIKSGGYIVATVKKNTGEFSASTHPVVHSTRPIAQAEAARLAEKDSSRKFIVLRIEAMASIPQPRPSVRWE